MSSTRSSDSSTALTRTDRRFVTKASEMNNEEVRLSQLAAQQASDPQVRSYAQMLVDDHNQSGTELSAIASRKGVVPADLVRQLSYDRADSVRKSILAKYKFDPNKFKVVGNGWDNPLPGCTDPSNAEHNKKNRRVEVKVFPLESGA